MFIYLGYLCGSAVKNLLVMQETWIRSLGWEDPLEREMATLLQNSYLGNSMDRGAWWATVQWDLIRVGYNVATQQHQQT